MKMIMSLLYFVEVYKILCDWNICELSPFYLWYDLAPMLSIGWNEMCAIYVVKCSSVTTKCQRIQLYPFGILCRMHSMLAFPFDAQLHKHFEFTLERISKGKYFFIRISNTHKHIRRFLIPLILCFSKSPKYRNTMKMHTLNVVDPKCDVKI